MFPGLFFVCNEKRESLTQLTTVSERVHTVMKSEKLDLATLANMLVIPQNVTLVGWTGPACAGKDEKGKLLTKLDPKFKQLVMSRMIQSHWDTMGSPFRAKLRDPKVVADEGSLQPDEPVIQIFSQELLQLSRSAKDKEIVVIANGLPRSVVQGKIITGKLGKKHLLVHLRLSRDESIARLKIRSASNPRPDDGAIEKRYQFFEEHTLKGIRVVMNSNPGAVHQIDATLPVRKQIAQILRAVGTGPKEMTELMALLDKTEHPAHVIMREIEGLPPVQRTPARPVRSAVPAPAQPFVTAPHTNELDWIPRELAPPEREQENQRAVVSEPQPQ